MASKIEHIVKYDAYTDALAWSKGSDKDSIIWWLKQKTEAHKVYLEKIRAEGKTFYATPPRSRFLNWLGHKCLAWAWGGNSYMAITLNQTKPKENV